MYEKCPPQPRCGAAARTHWSGMQGRSASQSWTALYVKRGKLNASTTRAYNTLRVLFGVIMIVKMFLYLKTQNTLCKQKKRNNNIQRSV